MSPLTSYRTFVITLPHWLISEAGGCYAKHRKPEQNTFRGSVGNFDWYTHTNECHAIYITNSGN